MLEKVEKEIDLVHRHLVVLQVVESNQPVGIVTLSNETDYAHHKVRYSLRMLEQAGLVEPTSDGAVSTHRTQPFLATLDDTLDKLIRQFTELKSNV
jgi:predicted transcriptional regulator